MIEDIKRFFDLKAPIMRKPTGVPLRILYLGRPHPLKGVEYLRMAIAGLNVELHEVSGKSGRALETEWERADVLCLPTLSDNFGLVIAEALERGIPVVTTDGAPAWRTYFEQHPDAGVYLKGYRDGTAATRVNLLATALNYEIRSNLNP